VKRRNAILSAAERALARMGSVAVVVSSLSEPHLLPGSGVGIGKWGRGWNRENVRECD